MWLMASIPPQHNNFTYTKCEVDQINGSRDVGTTDTVADSGYLRGKGEKNKKGTSCIWLTQGRCKTSSSIGAQAPHSSY